MSANNQSLITAFIVAAPSSGCGKTTVTLGLLAALKQRGLTVAPFKVGPDFIDPGHHAAACGRVSRNLDGWMCGERAVRDIYARGCAGADLAVVEGVMGLFDGADGDSDAGSTVEIARWLNGRILLVVDARSQARSAAALIKGFVEFDPRINFAGILFNRVGSDRHEQLLRQAVASVPGLPPVLGCLPRDAEVKLPERHLGLVTAEDAGTDATFFERLADWVEKYVDVEALLSHPPLTKGGGGGIISHPRPLSQEERGVLAGAKGESQVRIAMARDEAFCFYYPENLKLLEAAGAELVFFSPLRDSALPDGSDGLYLGGGYPELHAELLALNRTLLEEIQTFADAGKPVYAECGGLIYLSQGVVDADGNSNRFAGVFPAMARMLPWRKSLGYREVTLTADTLLGPAGTVIRGHEFHYSELDMPESVPRCYAVTRRGSNESEMEGFQFRNVLGSYVHLHFAGNPQVAENFVHCCRQRRERKG